MTSVREVQRALLRSELPPPARHIVLTLTVRASWDTGVIPAEHTPSLTTLSSMTGLAKSTVAEWLRALDQGGWVLRKQPPRNTRDARTTYTLTIGSSSINLPKRESRRTIGGPPSGRPEPDPTSDQEDPDTSDFDRPPGGPVRQADGTGSPPCGPLAVRPADSSSPPGGPASTKDSPSESPTTKTSPRLRKRVNDDRPDVERICTYLADKIEANGNKRPTITDTWRQQARLLLDEPRPIAVTVEKVLKAIDWCQADPFWSRNILSMPTLRRQYDRLRMAAQQDTARPARKLAAAFTNPDGGADHYRQQLEEARRGGR